MTLSAELRQIIVSHTAGMTPKERAFRAKALLKQYRITNDEDRKELVRLATVRMEDTL